MSARSPYSSAARVAITAAKGRTRTTRLTGDHSGRTGRRSCATIRRIRSCVDGPALVTRFVLTLEQSSKAAGRPARSQLGGAGFDVQPCRDLAEAQATPVMKQERTPAVDRQTIDGVGELQARDKLIARRRRLRLGNVRER